MKEYLDFTPVGLQDIDPSNKNGQRVILYYIRNTDGSIRWLWNQDCPIPIFLNFFAQVSFRAICIAWAYRLLFAFHLQHFLFRKNRISVQVISTHSLAQVYSTDFSLFTGTVGINRKWVLFGQKEKQNSQFYKISTTRESQDLIHNEFNQINKIQNLNLKNVIVPKAYKISNAIISVEDISVKSQRASQLTTIHIEALSSILIKTMSKKTMVESFPFLNAIKQISQLELTNDVRIPKGVIRSLKDLKTSFEGKEIIVGLAHRDFTSWNAYLKSTQLAIYDWELAELDFPAAYDLFHFVIQNSVLVDRVSWSVIKPKLLAAFNQFKQSHSELEWMCFNDYLGYYLFLNISYYLSIYEKQNEWHIQVEWLLNTWSEALVDILSETNSSRQLLIRTLFDFLTNKPYVTIKLNNQNPEKIGVYSDIDIATNYEVALSLIMMLKKSTLVKSMELNSKSFMHSIRIQLHDDSFFALDIIEKFVRKSLVYLDIDEVLRYAKVNSCGIKEMDLLHTKQYILNFYALNHSQIPVKYQAIFTEEELKSFNPIKIKNSIKKLNTNTLVLKIVHYFKYMLDTLRSLINTKVMTISFSGVDGAGKSTVIEHIKFELEKRFRKKVVVIRHRPSILPILSVWSKGRVEAEKSVLNSLPRKGTNKSILSSMIRFLYYYLDYFFGQFIILFRYNLRGTVVLYDRFYYDFILDGKRSNIELPTWVTRLGYRFIFSPNLNFFLYADSQTILSRKKELDENTIQELTNNYSNLFIKLNNQNKNYEVIENIELHKTIEKINTSILKRLSK